MTHESTETTGQDEKAPVVAVGIDGSEGAKAAFRWALAEARLRNAPLRVVHAWTHARVGGTTLRVETGDPQHEAEELLERTISDAATDAHTVNIDRQVVHGEAARALVAAVSQSDLLVVGSRGRGGFAELLVGSVSQHCVHHAPCPVVVVHRPQPVTDQSQTRHRR